MRFDSEGVLVTGGGSGIGQQVCYLAAKEGGRVAVADIDSGKAEATAEAIRRNNGMAVSFQVDVTQPDVVAGFVERAAEELGRLDVLVNSAGVREIAPVLDLSYEEWKRVLDINLSGTFLVSQAFTRRVVADGKAGRIVNLASILGLVAAPNRAAYTASKHGVVGLTKQMALELGDRGIRVNAVAPGVVRTPLTEEYFHDPELKETILGLHPIGRTAVPEEIANAILFLADEANGFVTGTIMTIDGGATTGKKF